MDCSKFFIEYALYPAMELIKHNRVRAKKRELSLCERDGREIRRERVRKRLAALLTECYEGVDAYKGKLTAQQIENDPEVALRSLPLTLKRDVRERGEDYINKKFPKEQMIPNATGGSTGEPLKFFMTRDAVEYYEAERFLGLSRFGISEGSRCIMVWGNRLDLNPEGVRAFKKRERRLKNRIIIAAEELRADKASEYAALIDTFKPEYLYGYAGALALLAKILTDAGADVNTRLKAVVSTSEALTDERRAAIIKAFSCPTVDEYGARDAGIIAYGCEKGNLHAAEENIYLEVVDPVTHAPVKTGESGLLAVTDLRNRAMPRLRFILGDAATLTDEPCPCGRTSRVIKSVDGREDAILVRPDGTLTHGVTLGTMSKKYPGIEVFKFIQHGMASATLYVVTKSSEDAEKFADEIRQMFKGMSVDVVYIDEIKPEKSGKFRYTVREFPLQGE